MANKRDTPQQQPERISRKQFEEYLEQHEWITSPVEPDMGEDILVRIYDSGVSTGLSFYTQLKSTDDIYKYRLKSGLISYPIKVKDLLHWEAQALPILLVVWDTNQKRGWWIKISDAIVALDNPDVSWRSKDPNKKVQIQILFESELTKTSLEQLRLAFAQYFYPVIAKGKDLEFQLKVSYPKTPDGKENFLQFQKHIEAGDELKLDGKYITEFIGSNWWTRLFGDVQVEELTMGPLSIPLSAPIQIEFWSPTYSSEKLSYVELKLEKQGTKELTISNVHQQIPFKINFLVNKVTNNWSFKFEGNWSGENILTVRRSLAIKKILNTGGEIRLTALSNGSSDMYQIPRGEFSESQNNTLIFLDKLCAIQDLFGKEFLYPEDGGIHKEDIAAADELLSIFNTGRHRETGMTFRGGFLKPGIEIMADLHRNNMPLRFTINIDDSFIDILSSRIELGPMTQYIKGTWGKPLDEVEKWLEVAKDDDAMEVKLVGAEVIEEFENWPRT